MHYFCLTQFWVDCCLLMWSPGWISTTQQVMCFSTQCPALTISFIIRAGCTRLCARHVQRAKLQESHLRCVSKSVFPVFFSVHFWGDQNIFFSFFNVILKVGKIAFVSSRKSQKLLATHFLDKAQGNWITGADWTFLPEVHRKHEKSCLCASLQIICCSKKMHCAMDEGN